jgi:hypothetical protein
MAHKNKWKHNLKARYNISGDQYLEWFNKQGGLCAICEKPESKLKADGKPFNLSVDHDHETHEIRGLLCKGCNAGLGFIGEDIRSLKRTIKYLRRSKRKWGNKKPKAQGTSLGW